MSTQDEDGVKGDEGRFSLKRGVGVLLLLGLLVAGGWWLFGWLGSGKSGPPKKPPTLTLLPDKPPPPPPPPKEEKKPEPKEEKKDMKMEQPKEVVPQPAQNEPLKMEGAAGEGESAFGAGSVSKDYIGGSVGQTGMQQGLYAGRLQRHLQDQLSRNRKLRESDYKVTVKIWLRRDGTVDKAELTDSTGNAALDQLLREALQQIAPMRELPPENLPQPLRIRVSNRGA